jgi:tetratricopeptide (TPR) repeat protein
MIKHNGPSPPAALVILCLAALILYPVLAHWTGEDRRTASGESPRPRILLIGLDAADWIMLDRWIGEGELPSLARLAGTGLRGDLRTLRPIISPLVWTTIATGQTPDRHGVTDFYAAEDGETVLRPVSRRAILVPPLWNIISDRGLSVLVTAWWASWPADQTLNGRVVTDQVQFAFPAIGESPETAPPPTDLLHPADLVNRLESCRLYSGDLDARAVSAFAPCTPADLATGTGDTGLMLFRQSLAATVTYYRMAREMLRDEQPDFAAIYFLGTDTVAHLYGQAAETDPRHLAPLRFYRLVDAMIGDLCAQVSPDTMVVLVSDHGFYTAEDRPSSDPADFQHQAATWHRPLGMVLFNAPWIAPGRLADASVLDIAPTLLWQLLDERFDSLPGRVLAKQRLPGAAGPDPARRLPIPCGPREDNGFSVPSPDPYKEQLMLLGYLGADPMPAARPVIHLADYLQWAGRPDEALEHLLNARDQLGQNPTFLARLAFQQSRTGDHPGALETLGAAMEQGWNPAATGRLAAAVGICCAAGRPDRAAALLDIFGPEAAQSSQTLTARALLAEYQGHPQEAVEDYATALETDPASSPAAQRICRLLTAGGPRLLELCRRVRQAAELRTGDATVQLNAGRLLLAAGDPEAARGPLGRAVHLEPDLAEPRLLLGRALYLSGRPAEACERLAEGLAWHPSHPQLLSAAGAAAVRAGYTTRGAALLERAAAAGATGPQLEAALEQARPCPVE